MKTKVSSEYFMNDFLCKQIFASNSQQVSSNLTLFQPGFLVPVFTPGRAKLPASTSPILP